MNRFESSGNREVQPRPRLGELGAIRDRLRERVPECALGIALVAFATEEVGFLEDRERAVDGIVVERINEAAPAEDASQDRGREASADHRRSLQDPLLAGRKTIDPGADERLDGRQTEVLEKDLPLDKVLASLTKLGVPLDAAPELKARKVALLSIFLTLRDNMRYLSDELEATWERRGDGYYLVPFDATKSKPLRVKGGD